MSDSLWFTTRSDLFRPGDAAWNETLRYEAPLRRLLSTRYRFLGAADRDDLVQEILLEIKERLAERFEPSRGRFRALLQSVLARRVVDRLRKVRPQALPAEAAELLAAPTPARVDALDLEAGLIAAVEACRDRFSGGKHKDLGVLHALSDRLIHGRSAAEIARQEGLSRHQVNRLLTRARDAIFSHLLARELELDERDPRLEEALGVFKQLLRQPTRARAALEGIPGGPAREALEEFWARFQAALPCFAGDLSASGRELARGVELVLQGEIPQAP